VGAMNLSIIPFPISVYKKNASPTCVVTISLFSTSFHGLIAKTFFITSSTYHMVAKNCSIASSPKHEVAETFVTTSFLG
jgi:hypothetical protein